MQEDRYWQAVMARERAADGMFVYGVRSTGIYCRPSCPARRPGRAQVVFFMQPTAAEAAGFRACRRCRPTAGPAPTRIGQPDGAGAPVADAALPAPITHACRYIEDHLGEPLTLDALGREVGLSPAHLQRTFKQATGSTPRQYAAACRLDRFKAQVRAGEGVAGALYEAGYSAPSRLYEQAPAQLGMTPATYRRGGAGAVIGYTVVACALGRLLVAATERGVCFVSMGDADAPLEAALAAEFPAATILRDDAGAAPLAEAIRRHLADRRAPLALPLDVQATAFQARVWDALRAIPAGQTRTYGQIAASLGQPSAARAVGRACATNPVPLLIPCHRAVRDDGEPGGYRWGRERKQALLAGERAG